MNAGAGTLPGGVKARKFSPPSQVGDDSAHRVVRSGSDGDGSLFGPIARAGEPAHQPGEVRAVDRAKIQQGDIPCADGARNHVPGRKLVRETLAVVVDEQRSGAAQRLAQKQARAG